MITTGQPIPPRANRSLLTVCRAVCLLLTALLLSPAQAGNIPESYPADRYDALGKHNPFTLSSISDEDSPVGGLNERFTLGGAFTIGSDDYIFLINKTTQERLIVSKTPDNPQGISLLSLVYDPGIEKTTAKIKVGEETGTLTYDPSQLKITNAPTSPIATPVIRPNTPGMPANNTGRATRSIRRAQVIAPPPPTRP